VANKLGYKRQWVSTVIQHQPDFPKPFKAHPKARPKWSEEAINDYLMKKAA